MLARSKRDDPFDLGLFQHTRLEHGQQNPWVTHWVGTQVWCYFKGGLSLSTCQIVGVWLAKDTFGCFQE